MATSNDCCKSAPTVDWGSKGNVVIKLTDKGREGGIPVFAGVRTEESIRGTTRWVSLCDDGGVIVSAAMAKVSKGFEVSPFLASLGFSFVVTEGVGGGESDGKFLLRGLALIIAKEK
ncbi:hypothetical protein L6452_02368 [Arctium lappa]|uniref:Uncharacterized protein n=1 Tax=Arctium lappa TaxID=4217 RepID=A0ACB9FIW2_ARCLA|nr:hypothetical protein L6452_02368 [Arctium lappa]